MDLASINIIMAEQMTPEEIQRIFAEYNEALKTGSPITKELADRMKDASKGVKGYADAQTNLTKILTKSAVDIGKAMYEGKQGTQVFTEQLSQVTDAIAGLLAVVAIINPALRVFATVAGGLALFGKAVNAAAKQQDQLFKSYQELSRSGMATAQGMSEVFPTMQKFGYGLEDLDKMISLVRENSRDLGRFAPNVAQGIQQVAGVATAIQHSGLQGQFMRMGMTVDDINKGIVGYTRQQGALGQLQGRTQADLTRGAAAYLKEMEGLARLTGQTREEMEKQREEANQIEIFYSTVAQMGETQQKELYATFNQLKSIDPTGRLALGYANSVSGLVGASDEAGQLFMATNGAVIGLVDSLKKGEITSAQFVDRLGAASKETEKTRLSLGQLGAGQDVYGSNLALTALQNKKAAEGMTDVEKGLKANEDATDKATASQVALRQAQMSSRDSLQKLGDTVGKVTTPAMEGFGKVVQTVTGILTGKGPAAGGAAGPMGGAGAPGATPSAPGGGAAPGAVSQNDLQKMGFKIKTGDVQAEGAGVSNNLLSLARMIQQAVPGFAYFSGFNDKFHQGYADSKHNKGLALDFALGRQPSPEEGRNIVAQLKNLGASVAIDEYNNPSRRATAGHFHAEVSAANGAILSGPMSGYKPNLTMHGTEAIVPLNSGAQATLPGADMGMKLEGLISVLRDQMDAQTRVMRDIADYTKKTSQYAGV
jgi:hypothetical protein